MMGTSLWVAHWLKWIPAYPGQVHAEAMMGGFFLTVAFGFLMTAIPKFTGTKSATGLEKGILFFLVVSLLISSLLSARFFFHLIVLLEIIFVARFGLPRFLRAAFHPAPSFILVGLGLFSAFFGDLLFLFHDIGWLSPSFFVFAKGLFFYGMFLGLVLGVGTQLIPSIIGLGRQSLGQVQSPTPLNRPAFDQKAIARFGLYGLILFASFVLESFWDIFWGRFVRALLVTFVVLFHWRIYQTPKAKGILVWCLWLSAWMLVLGVWPGVLFSAYAVHEAHILFIGSVSLMIFGVMTRVTLAHGEHDRTPELKSRGLFLLLAFLLTALLTRLLSPFVLNYYSHLAYASLFWILAALCWMVTFMPKVIKGKNG